MKNQLYTDKEVKKFASKLDSYDYSAFEDGIMVAFNKNHDAYMCLSHANGGMVRALYLVRHDGFEYDGIKNWINLEPYLGE